MIATIALSAVLAVLGPLADASDAANGSAASAAQAPENPAITRRVDAQFDAWQRGSLDRSLYALRANEQLGADIVGAISAHLKPLGTLHSANSLFKIQRVRQHDLCLFAALRKRQHTNETWFRPAGKNQHRFIRARPIGLCCAQPVV